MQALRVVRLQQLEHGLQSLDVQVPGAQACIRPLSTSFCPLDQAEQLQGTPRHLILHAGNRP